MALQRTADKEILISIRSKSNATVVDTANIKVVYEAEVSGMGPIQNSKKSRTVLFNALAADSLSTVLTKANDAITADLNAG